jgi:predicted phosphodiesterase
MNLKSLLIAVTVLVSILPCRGMAAEENAPLRFAVVGCGPYSEQDEKHLERVIEQENVAGVSEFMIHLGDIMSGSTPGTEDRFARVASLLQQMVQPVFIVPGDNEWNDQADPDKSWKLWDQYFMHFDQRWASNDEHFAESTPVIAGVRHQDVRPENFSFVRKGVLFIGINLPGGTVHDAKEWATRLPQNVQWIEANLERYGSKVRAAVVFAQAAISPSHETFFAGFRAAAKRYAGPVLYIHADGHRWVEDQPWPEKNILRVQTDQLGIAKPLLVSVATEGEGLDLFQFDRRQPSYRRGPYLALGGSDRMTIVWRGVSEEKPRVRIGKRPGKLKRAIKDKHILRRRTDGAGSPESLTGAPRRSVQYEASIRGLKPDTRYYYAVYEGETLVAGADEDHWFRTNPRPGREHAFRFWVVGDSGTGGEDQKKVAEAMHSYVAKDETPIDLFMHVGDMAYGSGKDNEFHNNFFAPYKATLRNTVCWPTMGNHEGGSSSGKTGVGPYYDSYVLPTRGEVGGAPSETEAYFSFDYANVHFICLDSHDLDRSPAGDMAQWLKADLKVAKADWMIAYWHHPPYTKGTHDSDTEAQLIEMRKHIMPILEDAGVDIVFTGHSHIYERSMLMDGAYATPTVAENVILDDGDGHPDGDGAYHKSEGLQPHQGTVQVVTGHGGTGVGRIGSMPVMRSVHVEHGSIIVDVDDDRLTAVMINKAGEQKDLFQLLKKGQVVPTRIEKPWQLATYVNWGRVNATAKLSMVPSAGKATELSITIPALPGEQAFDGQVDWKLEGSGWTVSPASASFTTTPGEETVLKATASFEKDLFPLPGSTVTVNTENGEKTFKGTMVMQPYKRTTVGQMASLPTIDGVLDAAELEGLAVQSDMIEYHGTGPAKFGTEFHLGIREDHFYIALQNHEPETDRLVNPGRDRDGALWLDNCNELFFQLDGEETYFQIIVDAYGQVFDGTLGSGGEGSAWNWDISTAAHRGDSGWSAEVLIAPGMFGRALKPGDKLHLNVTRTNPIHNEMTQWSHSFGKGHHQPAHFGTATVE